MKTLTMPSFGSDMDKGTIVEWYVKEGDKVAKGDTIASIETMKGLIDMEVFDQGVIVSLLAAEGDEIEVGHPIAKLGVAEEEIEVEHPIAKLGAVEEDMADASVTKKTDIEYSKDLSTEASLAFLDKPAALDYTQELDLNAPLISPAARIKAKELGMDSSQLTQGTGPNGAIILKDIEAALSANANSLQSTEKSPEAMMRKAIASTVSRSKKEIPHYYLQLDVLLNNAFEWLSLFNADAPPDKRILINALILASIARALASVPLFNGFYNNGQYQASESVHLGNAISLRNGGLIIPCIHDAQNIGLVELMQRLRDQVTRTRNGGLRQSEVQDATVTVSSLGDRGTDSIQSIIFPPQVAILGVGRPRTMPWVIEDRIEIANVVSISLAADHRVSDGHSGARLLNRINKSLQAPEDLL